MIEIQLHDLAEVQDSGTRSNNVRLSDYGMAG